MALGYALFPGALLCKFTKIGNIIWTFLDNGFLGPENPKLKLKIVCHK